MRKPQTLADIERAYKSKQGDYERHISKAERLELRATRGMSPEKASEGAAKLKLRGVSDEELAQRVQPANGLMGRFFWKTASAFSRAESRAGRSRERALKAINEAANLEREYHNERVSQENLTKRRVIEGMASERNYTGLVKYIENERATLDHLNKLLRARRLDGSLIRGSIEDETLKRRIEGSTFRITLAENAAKKLNPAYEEKGVQKIKLSDSKAVARDYLQATTIGELQKLLKAEDKLIRRMDNLLAARSISPIDQKRYEDLMQQGVKRKAFIVGKIALIREKKSRRSVTARGDRSAMMRELKELTSRRDASSGRRRAGLNTRIRTLRGRIEAIESGQGITVGQVSKKLKGARSTLRGTKEQIRATDNGQLVSLEKQARTARGRITTLSNQRLGIQEQRKTSREYIQEALQTRPEREEARRAKEPVREREAKQREAIKLRRKPRKRKIAAKIGVSGRRKTAGKVSGSESRGKGTRPRFPELVGK